MEKVKIRKILKVSVEENLIQAHPPPLHFFQDLNDGMRHWKNKRNNKK